jgi:hypothetical protein
MHLWIKSVNGGGAPAWTLTINPAGNEAIDGALTKAWQPAAGYTKAVHIYCDGFEWFIIGWYDDIL